MLGQATNKSDCGDAVVEHLVVERDEDGAHVLRLSQMLVEALVQGRQDSLPYCCIYDRSIYIV